MALPPTPEGFSNWNEYIEIQGAIVAEQQGLTFQAGKASVKLKLVAEPERQAFGTPSYRIYNIFTTWANRTVSPTQGRPWITADEVPSADILTQSDELLITQDNDVLLTQ